MITDYVSLGWKNICHRKLRSFLTILGIMISVMVIVALLMISTGLEKAIEEQFKKIGANRVYITIAGGHPGSKQGLTENDVDVLEKMKDLKLVTPYLFLPSTEVQYKQKKGYTTVVGWQTEGSEERVKSYDTTYREGRTFRDREQGVAVLGPLVAKEVFFDDEDRREIHVNDHIKILGREFKVVGIYDPLGNQEDDSQVHIAMEDARRLFNKPDEVSVIEATVKSGQDMAVVKKSIEHELERKRHNDDFEVLTPEQILQFLHTTLGLVRAILLSIAGVSLVVGAIGIMNSMYTAVRERTKEIGVMKSLGATNRNILIVFLIEAGMIGLAGGILGVLLGNALSFFVQYQAALSGFAILKITPDAIFILGGLLFAVIIGAFSGALPAKHAAALHPVDALRWIK